MVSALYVSMYLMEFSSVSFIFEGDWWLNTSECFGITYHVSYPSFAKRSVYSVSV
jgi:hypothetical protein